MRVTRQQAAENRERVIDVAAQLFREKGFDGIGIAEVMKRAGLTHGGFYANFASKDDLAAEACARSFARTAEKWEKRLDGTESDQVAALLDYYLSEAHRDARGAGCMMPSLATDAARQGRSVRRSFTEGFARLAEIFANALPERTKAAKRRKALAMLSEMVGAVVLARAAADPELSKEILAAARADLSARGQ